MQDVPSRVSWRGVQTMARHSRPGSAVYHVLGKKKAAWSPEAHLTAILINEIRMWRWQWESSKTPKDESPPTRPVLVDRPGVPNPVDPNAPEKLTGKPMDKADWANYWKTGVRA